MVLPAPPPPPPTGVDGEVAGTKGDVVGLEAAGVDDPPGTGRVVGAGGFDAPGVDDPSGVGDAPGVVFMPAVGKGVGAGGTPVVLAVENPEALLLMMPAMWSLYTLPLMTFCWSQAASHIMNPPNSGLFLSLCIKHTIRQFS